MDLRIVYFLFLTRFFFIILYLNFLNNLEKFDLYNPNPNIILGLCYLNKYKYLCYNEL